jgi:hypothetical protein
MTNHPNRKRISMDFRLEVVPIPGSEVARGKRSYSEQIGFVVSLDTQIDDEMGLVQLTPPGSTCSIHLSTGILVRRQGYWRTCSW